jgi:branched-chain amino acid transport system substrate-binding protein
MRQLREQNVRQLRGPVFLVFFYLFSVWPGLAEAAQIVRIGALLSLTGEWSSLGRASEAALNIGVDDINSYLKQIGSSRRIKLMVEDTQLKPEIAAERLRALAKKGVRTVIGPQSSAEVGALRDLVASLKVTLISHGSTASSLAQPSDNIFRVVPDDTRETAALNAMLQKRGVRVIVPAWRQDAGNTGLKTSLEQAFAAAGGQMAAGIGYATDAADFSRVVATLADQVQAALVDRPASEVGVYLAAFDEAAAILRLAKSFPVLGSVKWYGSDGVALSQALLNDAEAARFAASVDYPNPTLGLPESARSKWEPLSSRIEAQAQLQPDAFALAAYDALWIAALNRNGANNRARLQGASLPNTADLYFGATGWTRLNAAGDRDFGDYDFWAIRILDGQPVWVRVARYESVPGSQGTLVENK